MKNNIYKYERRINNEGYQMIAGIDEVGRGSLAGPIVVAICILPKNYINDRIKDSKKLSEKTREKLYEIIIKDSVDYCVHVLSAKDVDKFNPKKSSIIGMEKCIEKIVIKPDYILIDAEKINTNIKNESIIRGDDNSISIASASIIAKVFRDNIMKKLSKKYPQYYFDKNKGYGTKDHLIALSKFGPIKNIHRFTYKPIKK